MPAVLEGGMALASPVASATSQPSLATVDEKPLMAGSEPNPVCTEGKTEMIWRDGLPYATAAANVA